MYTIFDIPKHLSIDDVYRENKDTDKIFSTLILDDYDWMMYELKAIIPLNSALTHPHGWYMSVAFEYIGTNKSYLKLMQGNTRRQIEFDSGLFSLYTKKYLEEHIRSWDEKYAFSGEKAIIDFYNAVMDDHIVIYEDEDCSFTEIRQYAPDVD